MHSLFPQEIDHFLLQRFQNILINNFIQSNIYQNIPLVKIILSIQYSFIVLAKNVWISYNADSQNEADTVTLTLARSEWKESNHVTSLPWLENLSVIQGGIDKFILIYMQYAHRTLWTELCLSDRNIVCPKTVLKQNKKITPWARPENHGLCIIICTSVYILCINIIFLATYKQK